MNHSKATLHTNLHDLAHSYEWKELTYAITILLVVVGVMCVAAGPMWGFWLSLPLFLSNGFISWSNLRENINN